MSIKHFYAFDSSSWFGMHVFISNACNNKIKLRQTELENNYYCNQQTYNTNNSRSRTHAAMSASAGRRERTECSEHERHLTVSRATRQVDGVAGRVSIWE